MQNWSQEGFVVTKIKDTVPWTYQIKNLNDEPVIGTFYEKKGKKTSSENSEQKKYLKAINYTSSGQDMTIYLIIGLIKKNESIVS